MLSDRGFTIGTIVGDFVVVSEPFGHYNAVKVEVKHLHSEYIKIVHLGNLKRGQMPKVPHSLRNRRIYKIASSILQRCDNPNATSAKYYSEKGIECRLGSTASEVYQQLLKIEGYEPHLTIDRIDSNLHYESGNLRWATRREQVQKRSNNVMNVGVTIKGQSDWLVRVQVGIGKRSFKSFSINKYGFIPAHNLALIERQRIKEQYGV